MLTNIEQFQEFSDNPKSSERKTILGSIQYIEDSIVGKETGPTCKNLVHIFNQFEGSDNEDDNIKLYVYQRMTKPVLLELALAILKEIASGGPARAKNLRLAVKKTASNGKQVKIASPKKGEFLLSPEDAKFFRDIDVAEFALIDSSGSSPDVKVLSPQGCEFPLSQRAFTTPPAKRSLVDNFDEVNGFVSISFFDPV